MSGNEPSFEALALKFLVDALLSTANAEGLAGVVLRRAGLQFARQIPLRDLHSPRDLEARVNAVWRKLATGRAEVRLLSNSVRIRHVLDIEDPIRREVLSATLMGPLLEGWYEGWLRAFGGETLVTRVESLTASEIIFRHGNPA
jgi:hypothetical protein